jgi:hypothetical protein
MSEQSRLKSLTTSVVCLLACGCASGRMALTANPEQCVIVNGEAVSTAGTQNLLEVLRRKATAFRLGEQRPPDETPLVLVDGTAMTDGVRALAGIPATDVASVSFLRASDAVPRYGRTANHGAIIIQTRIPEAAERSDGRGCGNR